MESKDQETIKNSRSLLMSRVKAKNTKPEILVRKKLHALGYHFRIHLKNIPGTPDIVFTAKRKIIMIHGCFWHRHDNCKKSSSPKTRVDFWNKKFENNLCRDKKILTELKNLGWKVKIIWECEILKDNDYLKEIMVFLDDE